MPLCLLRLFNPLGNCAVVGGGTLEKPVECEALQNALLAVFIEKIDPTFRRGSGASRGQRRIGERARFDESLDGPRLAAIEAGPQCATLPTLVAFDVAEDEDVPVDDGETDEPVHESVARIRVAVGKHSTDPQVTPCLAGVVAPCEMFSGVVESVRGEVTPGHQEDAAVR